MVYWLTVQILKIFARTYLSGTVVDKENLPAKGPYVGVVNHLSNMDVVAMAMAVKTPVHTMVKAELFSVPVLGWWLRAVNMFPVVRNSSDSQAFNHAIDVLKSGKVLFIAPEGTRKKEDGKKLRPRTGFARMAQIADCPVVPIAIYGTDKVLSPGAWFPKSVKVAVQIGKPIKLEAIGVSKDKKEILQKQANDMMDQINSMYDELDQKYNSK